jgi:hypothetical protein
MNSFKDNSSGSILDRAVNWIVNHNIDGTLEVIFVA